MPAHSRTPGIVLALFELVIVVLTAVSIGSIAWSTTPTSEIGLLRLKAMVTALGTSTTVEAKTDDICAANAAAAAAAAAAAQAAGMDPSAIVDAAAAVRDKCDRAVASGKAAFAMHLIAIVVNGFTGFTACALAWRAWHSARGLWICITASVCVSACFMIIGIIVFGAGMHVPLKDMFGSSALSLGWSFGVDVAAVVVNFLAIFACWGLWRLAMRRELEVARPSSRLGHPQGVQAPVPVPGLVDVKVDYSHSMKDASVSAAEAHRPAPR
eukprot:tig00000202_g16615.t1